MTIETEVAALTTAADALTESVNEKKATLDASTTAASNSASASATSAAEALASKNLADTAKSAAETAQSGAETAESNAVAVVTGGTATLTPEAGKIPLAGADGKIANAWLKQELDAIDASIADTAVDVFIYDTTKDSDGGAWRKRCQGKSWYNETLGTATRGSRREFPAVAIIVVEAARVTIYDGDDETMPMWLVFVAGAGASLSRAAYHLDGYALPVKCAAMLNGKLAVGLTNTVPYSKPLSVIDFLSDSHLGYSVVSDSVHNIANRHTWNSSDNFKSTSHDLMVAAPSTVNDVAMTVLPNAPIDNETGLPIPTIAVATNGGVSIIKHDGSVVDIVHTAGGQDDATHVWFVGEDIGYVQDTFGARFALISAMPDADLALSAAYYGTVFTRARNYFTAYHWAYGGNLWLHDGLGKTIEAVAFPAFGLSDGVSIVDENIEAPSEGMAVQINTDYNTGWMVGDIKLAALSSNVAESLVGGELVTNGDFADDIIGWTDISEGTGSTSWGATGIIKLTTGVDTANEGMTYQEVPTVIGKSYTITVSGKVGVSIVQVGTASTNNSYFQSANDDDDVSYTFTAAAASVFVTLRNLSNTNNTSSISFLSVRLVDPDRSVNANGLAVHGTITKAAVATGADLMGYSGFSASNYLEQPYNSDLDFGTGDFCYMGWFVDFGGASAVSGTGFISRGITDAGGARFMPRLNSDETITLYTESGSTAWASPIPLGNTFICFVRKDGVMYQYINGVLKQTTALADSFTLDSAVLRVGKALTGWAEFPDGLALWRASATAPSADQIAKIYRDELPLFQENAQATLYGSSDSVTALAYDEDTELLHVGTSAGRSVFDGLQRVDNTTVAVTTAIAASDGMVVEQ